MPVVNGIGAFSVGRDCQIVLQGPFGQVNIPIVTQFDCKQETATIKVDPLNGQQMHAELPKGWTFSIECERAGPELDNLFSQVEASWIDGGKVSVSTLYQYVSEPDGSQSTYQLDNASIKYDDSGTWKGDASVKQKLSGWANRRRRV